MIDIKKVVIQIEGCKGDLPVTHTYTFDQLSCESGGDLVVEQYSKICNLLLEEQATY